MGKALIFSGVQVQAPLQTVTFVKTLVTASDYVNEYAKLATNVTSGQKEHLVNFVQTLMSKGLWDKVKSCFPMLGGIEGYNKDLKDFVNLQNWQTPSNGTTWDETRNAPYLNLPGQAVGTPLSFTIDCKSCAFFFSTKFASQLQSRAITQKGYGTTPDSFVDVLKTGDFSYPEWGTTKGNSNFSDYKNTKNANNMYLLNCVSGENKLYACSNKSNIEYVNKGTTDTSKTTSEVSIALGSYFSAGSEAPANYTLNGCINMFICFKEHLTDDEIQTVSKAVWDFDEACGRHTDFE